MIIHWCGCTMNWTNQIVKAVGVIALCSVLFTVQLCLSSVLLSYLCRRVVQESHSSMASLKYNLCVCWKIKTKSGCYFSAYQNVVVVVDYIPLVIPRIKDPWLLIIDILFWLHVVELRHCVIREGCWFGSLPENRRKIRTLYCSVCSFAGSYSTCIALIHLLKEGFLLVCSRWNICSEL